MNKGFASYLIVFLVVIIIVAGGVWYWEGRSTVSPSQVSVEATLTSLVASTSTTPPSSTTLSGWTTYTFQHTGIRVSIPQNFIPHESSDPVSRQVVFVNSTNTSESSIILLIKIDSLPKGETLLNTIQEGGVASSSVSSVTIGGQTYLTWFSPGEGTGNWNYMRIIAPGEVVSIATPSSTFVSSQIANSILSSLVWLGQ